MKKGICFTFALIALGQNTISAETIKQKIEKNYNLINYSYDGISEKGNGISVGFIDSTFNVKHPSFTNKAVDTIGSNYLTPYKSYKVPEAMHGTHVAGIAVGNYISNTRPYGIASQASMYGVSYLNPDYPESIGSSKEITDFLNRNNVKIVNNSWSLTYFPIVGKMIDQTTNSNKFTDKYKNFSGSVSNIANNDIGFKATIDLAKAGVLQVYSSGNEAQRSPSINGSMRSYDESLKAWINVGALDSEYTSGSSIKQQTLLSGKALEADGIRGGFTTFSNSFTKSQAYSMLAPGYEILSANAYYGTEYKPFESYTTCIDEDKFCVFSGTSQAAPFVSGAAALVAEKFGFLDGGGIADVLLSTANSSLTLPQIILKQSPTQWLDENSNKEYYYDIIYTRDSDKSKITNREQVKNDLINVLKLSNDEAEKVLKHLMYNSDGNTFATYMTTDELIGQGILDIQKALKGLAKLDANRLINSDVVGDQAFYTINTKGLNGEFNNNIEQVEWKPEWHLNTSKLSGITKIGLIKTGDGTLTLSGANNTYQGDTIADGGILKLTGTLANSSAFARGGEFNLNGGTINKSATALNGGIFSFTESGTILGNLESKAGGTLLFNAGSSLNVPNVTNAGILKGQGTITGNLVNNGVVKAGFFNENTDTADKLGGLEVKGAFTQNTGGTLQLAFSKLSENPNDSKNSNFKANSYTINGGSLQYVPLQVSSSLIKANDEITIKLDDEKLKNELDSFTSISALPTKLLTFTVDKDDKTKLFAVNKPVSGEDADIMRALQGVLSNTNISASSANALANLENLPQGEYNEALKSIKDTPNNAVVKSIDNIRKTTTLKNTLFLINPFSSLGSLNTQSVVFAPTAAFGDEYFGKADDIFIKTEYSGGFTFSKTSHDDFDQKTYLIDLQAKKAINDSTELGAFLGLGKSKTEKSNSEIDSNIFSLGLSAKHDLGEFGVLGSASFGMSFNDYEQNIAYVPDSKSTADYKNYFLGLQAGVYKHFALSQSTQITPLALLEYTYIHQNAFKQKGALAKNFDAKNTNFLRTYLGANLAHKTALGKYEISADAFAFYWHKFNNNKINQNLNFVEAKANAFKNTQKSEKNGFYGGVSLQARRNNIFAKITLSDEKTSAYNEFEVMLRLGLAF